MKITPLLVLLAALLVDPAAAETSTSWNNPPYASRPPLVTNTPEELKTRLDEITTFPTELDPRLWADGKLRPEVRSRTLEIARDVLAGINIPELTIKDIEVRGSTVSYEYDENSDFSVRIFLDTSKYEGDASKLGGLLKLYTDYLEAMYEGRILLHGVPVELQFYTERTSRLAPEKGIGHYSIVADAWLEQPVKQESQFDQAQMTADAARFIAHYNSLVTDYFAGKKDFDCGRFSSFTKELRGYRHAGIEKDGIRSTANLTYRLLRRLNVNVTESVRMLKLECQTVHWSLE